jgi:hypothetical protein
MPPAEPNAERARRSPRQLEIRRTPTQVLGQSYPVIKPGDQDADHTVSAGRTGGAAGSRAKCGSR